MTLEKLGIVDRLQETAALYATRHPHLARRIDGKPPIYDTRRPIVTYITPPPPPPTPLIVAKLHNRPTPAHILGAVGKSFEVTRDELLGRWRPLKIAQPRMACYRLIREFCRVSAPLRLMSFPEIGRLFKRDHSSIQSGIARTGVLLECDANFRLRYHAARAELVLL